VIPVDVHQVMVGLTRASWSAQWPGVADGNDGQLVAIGTVPARLDDRKLGTTATSGAWSVWFEPSRSACVRSAARRAACGPSKAEPAADAGPAAPQAPPCLSRPSPDLIPYGGWFVKGQLDGPPVTRWSGAAGEAAPLALSFEDFLGAFPVFLLRRRARTSGGWSSPWR